ncbi:tyrosine-type recombinase/integrase [Bacillus sp. AFS002410]|uniref:tyrosine-type recombinase/integrase n=1 Tax=Bacillus sp. AFS002410 TaxID=2033481 RepID=UPI0035A11530
MLVSLKTDNNAVFMSQKDNRTDQSTVWSMITKYAKVSGITEKISPLWFRHAHASHSLEAGAPIHLVKYFRSFKRKHHWALFTRKT